MKIAVTGGSGQLGTLVLRKLAQDRKVTLIRSLDVRPPIVANRKVEAVHADVRDPAFVRHLEGMDALVHLAFIVTAFAPRPVMDAVNVEGSKNVFTAAARAGVRAIVYSSSVAAYGVVPGHPTPIVEETPRIDQSAFTYASNKFAVEAFLDAFEIEHPQISIARLRPGILVGARMEHVLGTALDAGILPDASRAPLPWVWDEDVAAAAVLCLKKGAHGAWNLVAEDQRPTAELAPGSGLRRVPLPSSTAARAASAALTKLSLAVGVPPSSDPAWLTNEMPTFILSSDKARRDLGFTPTCPTARDVLRRKGEIARGLPDLRLATFFKLVGLAARRLPPRGERARGVIHLELTGRGGADVTIRLDEDGMRLAFGVPRPPTTVISLRADTFLEMLRGRLTPATAELTGKFRLEGDPTGALVLSGLVSMFRAQVEAKDGPRLPGWAARRLAAWFERG